MFIALGLNGRSSDLYSGMSSGDCGLGELGPKRVVRVDVISSTSSSVILRPSIIVSRMYLTRVRQPSSSNALGAMRFWNEWQDCQQVVKNVSRWLRSWSLVLGRSFRPWYVLRSLQRTLVFCSAKSNEAFWSEVNLTSACGSLE